MQLTPRAKGPCWRRCSGAGWALGLHGCVLSLRDPTERLLSQYHGGPPVSSRCIYPCAWACACPCSKDFTHPNITHTYMYAIQRHKARRIRRCRHLHAPTRAAAGPPCHVASSPHPQASAAPLQVDEAPDEPGVRGKQLQQVWIVSEYCDSGTLNDAIDRGWLRTRRALDAPPDMRALLQTAQASSGRAASQPAAGIER